MGVEVWSARYLTLTIYDPQSIYITLSSADTPLDNSCHQSYKQKYGRRKINMWTFDNWRRLNELNIADVELDTIQTSLICLFNIFRPFPIVQEAGKEFSLKLGVTDTSAASFVKDDGLLGMSSPSWTLCPTDRTSIHLQLISCIHVSAPMTWSFSTSSLFSSNMLLISLDSVD